MKRLAIVFAATIIFASAYTAAAMREQVNTTKQTNIVAAKPKPDTKPTPTATPSAPRDVETPEPDPTPTPTPEPAKTAQKTVSTGDCEQWRPLVSQYDWDVRTAMAVMQQESTMNGIPCNNMAINPTDDHTSWAGCMGSFGLFQINCSHGAVYDPAKNIAIAYSMWRQSGWSPWSAYTSGEYAKYLR